MKPPRRTFPIICVGIARALLDAGARVNGTPFAPDATRIHQRGSVCPEIRAMLEPPTRSALKAR